MDIDSGGSSTPDTLTIPDLASATLALTITSSRDTTERRSRSKDSDLTSSDAKRLKQTAPTDYDSDLESRGRSKEREDGDEVSEKEEAMIALMGFSGFGTTKGKHVAASKGGQAKLEKNQVARQYLNRTKGFNRPLSPGKK